MKNNQKMINSKPIEMTIGKVEKDTSAEFIVAVMLSPGLYWPILFALIASVGAIIFGAVYLLAPWPDFTRAAIFALLGMVVSLFLLLEFHWLHFFVPISLKLAAMRKVSERLFRDCGLHTLPEKNGVLLLVMKDERLVHVAAGQGLLDLTGDKIWQDIVAEFVVVAKKEPLEEAITQAIRAFGVLLKTHFPNRSEKANLIANRLILI